MNGGNLRPPSPEWRVSRQLGGLLRGVHVGARLLRQEGRVALVHQALAAITPHLPLGREPHVIPLQRLLLLILVGTPTIRTIPSPFRPHGTAATGL